MKPVHFVAVIAWLVVSACAQPQTPAPELGSAPPPTRIPPPQATLPDGFVVHLELAITPEEIANGLMFRPSLPADRGMLFLFGQPRRPAFWMKNTLISLDLVFLGETGQVVDLIAEVPPCAADPCPNYPPSEPAMAVLEIGAGVAAAHGLEVGSTIAFERVPGYPILNDELRIEN